MSKKDRDQQKQRKRAAKARRMSVSGAKSRYARKKDWRKSHCGSAPLPCFPDVMALPPHRKPWG